MLVGHDASKGYSPFEVAYVRTCAPLWIVRVTKVGRELWTGEKQERFSARAKSLVVRRFFDVSGTEGASMSLDEAMECPVCWEGFNDAENTPYVLGCGHSLCRNCIYALPWAMLKLPFLPLQMPLLIACPCCQFLTLRMAWKGTLRYPCKNFCLLWIVESLKGDNVRQRPQVDCAAMAAITPTVPNVFANPRPRHRHLEHQQRPTRSFLSEFRQGGRNLAQWQLWLARILAFSVQLTAKIPLVFLFLFIVCYVLPFSTLILAAYAVGTVGFAIPAFLAAYFSYPTLDWLAREIVT